MKETCSMCSRRANSLSTDGTQNYVQSKQYGTLCRSCADATGAKPVRQRKSKSGVKVKASRKRRVRR